MKIVSACLLGIDTNYKGSSKPNEKLIEMFKKGELIPICPEQLGGLTTPRPAAEIKDGKVFTVDGKDVTENFTRGAEEVLKIAKLLDIKEAVLKARSPSCGCGKIYTGGELVDGDGILTALLKENGISVTTEEEI